VKDDIIFRLCFDVNLFLIVLHLRDHNFGVLFWSLPYSRIIFW